VTAGAGYGYLEERELEDISGQELFELVNDPNWDAPPTASGTSTDRSLRIRESRRDLTRALRAPFDRMWDGR